MSNPSSPSGGVPVFSIGGRMVRQRERLLGMTDEERRWRAQYLKDLKLEPDEPRFSPEYYKATTNIFKRTCKIPTLLLGKAIAPIVGKERAEHIRFVSGKITKILLLAYAVTYYFKYNGQDWTSPGGVFMQFHRRKNLPGDPDYPNYVVPKNYEYFDLGFSKTHFFKKE